jgi:photosystem II stability/assembly factor-like uncharacterized protein
VAEILNLTRPDLWVGTRRGLYGLFTGPGETEAHPLALWGQQVSCLRADTTGRLLAVGTAASGIFYRHSSGELKPATGFEAEGATALGADPKNGLLWAGAAPTGLYRSSDRGISWEEVPALKAACDTADAGSDTHRVTDLLVAGDNLYAAVYGLGILRSADSGRSFQLTADGPPEQVRALAAVPAEPDTLYAGTEDGLFVGRKAGAAWQELEHDDARLAVTALGTTDTVPGLLLVGGARRPGAARPAIPEGADSLLYRSEDSGRSFEELRAAPLPLIRGSITAWVFHPASGERVYAAVSSGEVLNSSDTGRSWKMITSTLPGALAMTAGEGLQQENDGR